MNPPTEKPANVRIAGPRDEAPLFALLVEMHRRNNAGWGIPFTPAVVQARIETATRRELSWRTNPRDERRGIIGLIGPEDKPYATIGLFIEPAAWFTADCLCLMEIWLYVRDSERDSGAYQDLFAFGLWAWAHMKADLAKSNYPLDRMPFPYVTGVMNDAGRIEAMERLWRRASGGEKVGALFMRR